MVWAFDGAEATAATSQNNWSNPEKMECELDRWPSPNLSWAFILLRLPKLGVEPGIYFLLPMKRLMPLVYCDPCILHQFAHWVEELFGKFKIWQHHKASAFWLRRDAIFIGLLLGIFCSIIRTLLKHSSLLATPSIPFTNLTSIYLNTRVLTTLSNNKWNFAPRNISEMNNIAIDYRVA